MEETKYYKIDGTGSEVIIEELELSKDTRLMFHLKGKTSENTIKKIDLPFCWGYFTLITTDLDEGKRLWNEKMSQKSDLYMKLSKEYSNRIVG